MSKKNTIKLENIDELHVELGYQCNLRCIMCFQKDYTQKINPDIWQKKLLPLYPHLKRLIIQGGEPTVIPASKDLVDLALKENKDIKFGIMTNGLLFDEYWQKLFVEHGYSVNFSLNGADKEVHEKINVHSKFDKVMKNLQDLIDLRNIQKSDLEISISFVIIPENLHQLTDFVELANKLGVEKVRFFFDASRLPEDVEEVRKNIDKALQKRNKYKDNLKVEGLFKFFEYYSFKRKIDNPYSEEKEDIPPRCLAPWKSLYVDHYGKTMQCCMSNVILGDLNKSDLEDLINVKKARDFRAKMAKGDFRYCQATCLENTKPKYGLNISNLRGYLEKFFYDFKQSPSVAFKKVLRKLKQLV